MRVVKVVMSSPLAGLSNALASRWLREMWVVRLFDLRRRSPAVESGPEPQQCNDERVGCLARRRMNGAGDRDIARTQSLGHGPLLGGEPRVVRDTVHDERRQADRGEGVD